MPPNDFGRLPSTHQRDYEFFIFILIAFLMVSAVFYYTYVIKSPIDSSEIPTIKISCREDINDEDYVDCSFQLESKDESDNIPSLNSKIKLRGRLNAKLPKKGYRIELSEERSLLGMRRDDDWLLIAMYRDLTNMRIKLSFDMWRSLEPTNPTAILPDTKYVNLFLNGEFKGLYLLAEKNDRRLYGLDDAQNNYNSSLIFQSDSHDRNFKEHSNEGWEQDWPNEYDGIYIKEDVFSKLIPIIKNTSDEEFFDSESGVYSIFNKQNLIDFFIFNFFILHKDFWSHNYFLVRNSSPSKFFLIPWDFDVSFGQSLNKKFRPNENPESEICSRNYLFKRLICNMEFRKEVKERWFTLRASNWTECTILDRLSSIYEKINIISEIDTTMWYPWYLDTNWPLKVKNAVEELFEWIPKRFSFCDEYFSEF
ncbi:MAG: CotH kinase family protein [Promethearchaeota archaeon]